MDGNGTGWHDVECFPAGQGSRRMSVRPGPDQARACVAESGSGSRLVDRRWV
ncbi:hypothetical protein CROQUDRAFT_653613, partial [Cronartium quercuum f. sp. fusiforme G11]